MSEQDISRILKDAIPDEPGMQGWGDGVRRAHRRRQVTISVAAVTGVVALAAPLALQLGSSQAPHIYATPQPASSTSHTPSPTSLVSASPTASASATDEPSTEVSQPPATGGSTPGATQPTAARTTGTGPTEGRTMNLAIWPEACQEYGGTVTELPDGRLRQGATKVWLCNGEQDDPRRFFGPPEPLTDTQRITSVIDSYNQLPAADLPAGTECPEDDGPTDVYNVILEYPGRSPVVISGQSNGCRVVTDGSSKNERGKGNEWLDTMSKLWAGQRAADDYSIPGQPGSLCMESDSMTFGDTAALVRGMACGVDKQDADPSTPKNVKLPSSLVKQISAELGATAVPAKGDDIGTAVRTLVLQSRWGDPITLRRDAKTGDYLFGDGDAQLRWTPSGAVATQLDELAKDMRKDPFPNPQPYDACTDPNQVSSNAPLAEVINAQACVNKGNSVYGEGVNLLDADVKLLVDDFARNATPVGAADHEVTGSFIVLQDADGKVHQLYLATDGYLLWDRPTDMVRLAAKPGPAVVKVLREAGLQVK